MKKLMIVLLLAGVFASGCSYVAPSHARAIDLNAENAVEANLRVQADPNCPEWVKRWMALDTQAWGYMSDWGHGRRPSPASQPAK